MGSIGPLVLRHDSRSLRSRRQLQFSLFLRRHLLGVPALPSRRTAVRLITAATALQAGGSAEQIAVRLSFALVIAERGAVHRVR